MKCMQYSVEQIVAVLKQADVSGAIGLTSEDFRTELFAGKSSMRG